MAFMEPYYSNEPFARIENKYGESTLVPLAYAECEDGEIIVETYENKWFCHLSADGYMDQTDWDGPYDTEDEAREAIRDAYGVDPDSGDELEED